MVSFFPSVFCQLFVKSFIEDTIYDHKFLPDDALGLDHIDKSGKTRGGTGEKAIVIKG